MHQQCLLSYLPLKQSCLDDVEEDGDGGGGGGGSDDGWQQWQGVHSPHSATNN